MGEILLKVHRSYRPVVAICDKELYGKVIEEGIKCIDLRGQFFDGEEMGEDLVIESIRDWVAEDATFNIVGKKSIKIAEDLGMITEEGVMYIGEVPFALILL